MPATSTPLPETSIWNLPRAVHAFVDTPEFYQRMIGECPPVDQNMGHNIATGIELETLVTCSDGSFDPETKTGSHGWVLATTDKIILSEGSGPTDGHPSSLSSYRAELRGLIAVLYTIYRICKHCNVTSGKVKYHCDNKGVIKNVFHPRSTSITQYLQSDYELVLIAQHLLSIIPATIIAEWVKGHYNGDYREFKHDLNDRADHLAGKFNKRPPRHFRQQSMPCLSPGYSIRLLYDK
jgi:ribonuclease HI